MTYIDINILYNYLLRDDLFILVIGSTGTGKTNDVLNVIELLYRNGKNAIIFDPKGEYLDRLYIDSVIYMEFRDSDYQFLWNPLIPPRNVDPDIWVRAFSDIFTRMYGLSNPSRRILHDSIEELYLSYKVYSEDGIYPTLRLVEEEVKKYEARGRELDSRKALENRLHIVNYGNLGDSLNIPYGIDLPRLYNHISIIDLSAVTSITDQRFLINLLLTWIFLDRRFNRYGGGITLVLEEAHRYIPEDSSEDIRSMIELLIAEGRTYGMRFIVVDQTPSLLSRQVMANCGIKIVHRLDSIRDIRVMTDVLNISEHDFSRIMHLSHMDTGYAMVSFPMEEYDPFETVYPVIKMPIYKGFIGGRRVISLYDRRRDIKRYLRQLLKRHRRNSSGKLVY